jgi:hypothetical protein
MGKKKFNMESKKGMQFLISHNLVQETPEDVAQFLYKEDGLNKTAIGDYLGEKNDFNEAVLKAFVELHDFTDLILVQALRQFLWSFRLPGEAQKIDRMMESFAQRYCQLNPDLFTNPDTCYVLSFAIIMLNTSLHNPSVKDKPSVEQFITMNRGINDGENLPRELLVSLFDSIKTEPFKIPEDDGNDLMHTFFNPDKEGWLWKQGGRYKSWKRRWFILNDNCLYYFEFTTDKEPRGIIPLENISVGFIFSKRFHQLSSTDTRCHRPEQAALLRALLFGQRGMNIELPVHCDAWFAGYQGLQDGQRREGGGGEAHGVPDVGQHGGGEGRLDQVHPVSNGSVWSCSHAQFLWM